MEKTAAERLKKEALSISNSKPVIRNIYDELASVDYVPPNLPEPNGRAMLVLLEDNDPVIQICIKGRNPTLRHVPRVHRVNTDATYERIRDDPGIYMRYWPTKYQLADILTKGSFTKTEWDRLVDLLQIRPSTPKIKKDKIVPATEYFDISGNKTTKPRGNKKRGKPTGEFQAKDIVGGEDAY